MTTNHRDRTGGDDLEKQKSLINSGHYDVSPGDELRNPHLRDLHIFQNLVGIRTQGHILRPGLSTPELFNLRQNTLQSEGGTSANKHKHDDLFDRPKRKPFWKLFYDPYPGNQGYYGRAMNEQQTASYWFNVSSTLINMIYIIQILTAATITGLASYTGNRTVLTVLGAINTVLAGLMAYLKGQGLPTRLLRSRDQFSKVMEYTEYKERQFSQHVTMLPDTKKLLDPYQEADRVRDLFVSAKKDQQENYPDTYLNNNERATMSDINAKNRSGFTAEELEQLIQHGLKLKAERDQQPASAHQPASAA